jgi:hypothetical protein
MRVIAANHAEIRGGNLRTRKLFAAYHAANHSGIAYAGENREREAALARQLQLPQQLPGALPMRTRQSSGPCSR